MTRAIHTFNALPSPEVENADEACHELVASLKRTHGIIEDVRKILQETLCKGKKRTSALRELASSFETAHIAFEAGKILELKTVTLLAARNIILYAYSSNELKAEAQSYIDQHSMQRYQAA